MLVFLQTVSPGSLLFKKNFMELLKFKNRQLFVKDGECFLHWINLVHCPKIVEDYLVRVIEHSLYAPDMAPADFFLFSKLKKQLDVA